MNKLNESIRGEAYWSLRPGRKTRDRPRIPEELIQKVVFKGRFKAPGRAALGEQTPFLVSLQRDFLPWLMTPS